MPRVLVPRFLGGIISMPLLTAVFTMVGLLGAHLVAVELMGVDVGAYWQQLQQAMDIEDVQEGIIKSFVFRLQVRTAWQDIILIISKLLDCKIFVLIQKFDYLENGQEEEFSVSIAGRVMAKRVMGKIAFFTISDQEGQIQLYLDKRIINLNLEKEKLLSFEDIKEIVDIGDWIGVYGTIKKTNKGELSIKVEKWEW